MPNITEFDAGSLGIRPSETGVESFAAAGRRIGAFYNQVAETKGRTLERLGAEAGQTIRITGDAAVNYMDHQQINAGADHASQMWANLQDNWNQTQAKSDPHDPAVAKKWREEVLEPTLDQFTQGFTTDKSQNWANERVNSLRQHFYATTEADMSHNAKVAVEATLRNMHNNYTNALINDPSGLSGVMDQIEHSTEGVLAANPNIKGPDAAEVRLGASEKLKEAAVKAAVQGAILKGTNWQSIANNPKYSGYIDAGEMKAFAKAAEVQDRANVAYTKQIELANRQLATKNADDIRAQSLDQFTKTDPNTGATTIDPQYYQNAKRVLTTGAPNAAQTYQDMINWADAKRKIAAGEVKPVTDQQVYSQLSNLVQTGDPNAENAIRQAAAQFRLAPKEESLLLNWNKSSKEIGNDPLWKYATDQAKVQIEGALPFEKQVNAGKFPAFMQALTEQYLAARRNGTLKPDDLDLTKPDSMISKAIAQAKPTLSESITATGGVAPLPVYTAPAPAPTVTLPPIASRVKGQSYPTARGQMEWTGTGWRPPQPISLQPGQM